MNTTAAPQRNTDFIVIILSYLGFIGLGMANGILGLAWSAPQGSSIRTDFVLELDAVGLLLLASTCGYLLASFYSGQIAYRIGIGRMLILSSGLVTLGLLGYVITPSWGMMIVAGFITGLGNGGIDAGLNAYIAEHHSPRVMNWLHACYGLGTTLSPLIMTLVRNGGSSWRLGYGIVGGFEVLLVVGYVLSLKYWHAPVRHTGTDTPKRRVSIFDTLKLPLVWIGVAMCFIYAGLEATPGQWTYSLFTDARHIDAATAGLLVSVYWGGLTLGRVFFGAIINRLSMTLLTRLCILGVTTGAAVLWWNPLNPVSYAALALMGFIQAPIFAVLMTNTPKNVGNDHAPNAIGFQIAGGGLGIAVLPALAGVLAKNITLEIVPPFVVVAGILVFALHELSLSQSHRAPLVEQPSGAD